MKTEIENVLIKNRSDFHPVVHFNPAKEKLYRFDFSSSNNELTVTDIADTQRFSQYVDKKLESHHAKFGIGGYNENRVLYKRSRLFEPAGYSKTATLAKPSGIDISSRSVHLGIDIWGPVGTEVFVPVGGMVHSFAFNDHFGDYGATIILQHQLDTIVFHTLYGHVSLDGYSTVATGQIHQQGRDHSTFW